MPPTITTSEVRSILTRATGFLKPVCSHSLQPYRGCTFGGSLCGVGCYVQHNGFVTRGQRWGAFLEARVNAADAYARDAERERRWARQTRGRFSIFMSSSTDPFVPQEDRFRVTRSVLEAMVRQPPDELIVQSHTHRAATYLDLYRELLPRCDLRIHVSIETDRERLPGLPPPASSVTARFAAAQRLREAGVRVVITVSPLLPIQDAAAFFTRIATAADAVVIDHFIEGDGSADGSRTLRTSLPAAMRHIDPRSTDLAYRDEIVAIARRIMPGRVGVSAAGFAGRFLP
jgi:DNA repair photolyase